MKNKACKYYVWSTDPRADTQSNNELRGIGWGMDEHSEMRKRYLRDRSWSTSIHSAAWGCSPKEGLSMLVLLNVFILVKAPIYGLTAKNSEAGTVNSSVWFHQVGCIHIISQSQEKKQNPMI